MKKIFRQLDFSRSLLYYQLVVDIRAGSVPEFFGSGFEFEATFGSGSNRFYLKLNFRFRFYKVRFYGSDGFNILS